MTACGDGVRCPGAPPKRLDQPTARSSDGATETPPHGVAVASIKPHAARTVDGLPIPVVVDAQGSQCRIVWCDWLSKHNFFLNPVDQAAARLAVRCGQPLWVLISLMEYRYADEIQHAD